jgi:hypothetical protein
MRWIGAALPILIVASAALAADPVCGRYLEASDSEGLIGCRLRGTQGDGSPFERDWEAPEPKEILPIDYEGVVPPVTYNATCSNSAFESAVADPAGRCVPPTSPRVITFTVTVDIP